MNRPFTALGTLGALLALAMFAVSSSGRSTTVQPVKSAHQRQRASRTAAMGDPITVAPADEDGLELESAPSSEELGLPDSLTGAVESVDSLPALPTISKTTFSTTRIELATEIRATWLPLSPMDCLAHNDPAYDQLVYGVPDATKVAPPLSEVTQQGVFDFDAECLGMFQELVGQVKPTVAPHAAALRKIKHTDWKLPSAAGMTANMNRAQIWLVQQIEQIAAAVSLRGVPAQAAAGQPLSWGEYADLIDDALDHQAAKQIAAATSGKVATVRSGD